MKKLLLKIKHKKLLEEIESIHIRELVLYKYKFDVGNNKDRDFEYLRKKLKRNFILGEKINEYKIRYGNLIIFHSGSTITNIVNEKRKYREFNIDHNLKKSLNILLDIE